MFLLRNITTTELTIIKSICNGVAQNVIAGQLSRSIKTINAHKMRALYNLVWMTLELSIINLIYGNVYGQS
ncbi:hypothetical protein DR42_004686 [Salmonella enterica subsp. enterica]|nr:hypothetical protein [Salmonella enterica subsp. enterica]